MDSANELILLAGAFGVVSILAGTFAIRFKAPLLLVFLGLGMLAGEDGPGGIVFDDMQTAYLVGSLALAVILFGGGLKTSRAMVRAAFWPAAVLATAGVIISAVLIGALMVWRYHLSPAQGLVVGAALAPTDAAAVATLLHRSGMKIPERVAAVLELESGVNDPISVFLMVLAVMLVRSPAQMTLAHDVVLVLREMLGGAAFGIGGGYLLLVALRRLRADTGIYPVLALAGALSIFGGAQMLEASGFLAVYVAGYIIGNDGHENTAVVDEFFNAFSWIAQIGLFLMLGLLVTPHRLLGAIQPALVVATALIFIARPVAGFICLLPFRLKPREIGFISWVGLRGAAPIYLTLIPLLAGLTYSYLLFSVVFVVVITSLVVQGWTIGLAAKLAGFVKL